MRRLFLSIFILLTFMIIMCNPVYATGGENLTLDEIIALEKQVMKSTEIVDVTTENTKEPGLIPSTGLEEDIKESSNTMMQKLGEAAVLDTSHPKAEQAAGKLKNIVNIIITILCYIITLGLTLRVVIDLIYIGLPFTRKFLANGFVGNARAGDVNAAAPMGGLGLGMGPGFGSPGYGMGSRFGLGPFGGLGGFGNRYGMGVSNSPGAYQDQMGMMTGRLQLVSNAALNAVASETTIDPDGRNASSFRIYAKDMMFTIVITPILLILAISGALFHVGLVIGGALVTILSGIGNMF